MQQARRLALVCAGLLRPALAGLPATARGAGPSAHHAAVAVVRRFGYLQLDTVSVAGARSHSIVLLSRLRGLAPQVGEELLRPGAPVFEYWGHEASYLPLELYPALAFRRRQYRDRHPWWGDVTEQHGKVADVLRRRLRDEGPLRSLDLDGPGGSGWWDFKIAKRVANAMWMSGELAIRERRNFQRLYDLAERVIPAHVRDEALSADDSFDLLVLKALDGHGWATTATIAATWRVPARSPLLAAALARLQATDQIVPCTLQADAAPPVRGWVRHEHLQLAAGLERLRPRADRGVLLSPFDPVLWDRRRVARLFGFDQVLEIFKPAAHRRYGYYCLPVLAGDRLVARYDLKAERARGVLRVLSCRYEAAADADAAAPPPAADRAAAAGALARYAAALQLQPLC